MSNDQTRVMKNETPRRRDDRTPYNSGFGINSDFGIFRIREVHLWLKSAG